MSQNKQTTELDNDPLITYETENDTSVSKLRTPDDPDAKAAFRAGQAGDTPLHQHIIGIVREHNATARELGGAMEIPEEIIELPPMATVRSDTDGRSYIEDMNTVIRYYFDKGEVTMTEDFLEIAQTVDSTERTNTFATIYNVA